MDKEKTKTVFRFYRRYGEVIALFPQIAGDIFGESCLSYMHIGQHSAADPIIVVKQTRLAVPKEYKPLLKELKQLGYNVQITKKCTYRDQQIRRKNAKCVN